MAEAYYRKWRPLGWEGLIGQDHVVRTLQNAVHQGRIAHAYLSQDRAEPAKQALRGSLPRL